MLSYVGDVDYVVGYGDVDHINDVYHTDHVDHVDHVDFELVMMMTFIWSCRFCS